MKDAVYDLQRLFAIREALDTLDVMAAPTARLLYPTPLPPVRRVGVLCGSFNPLTLAHTELAGRAAEVSGLDIILFTLAKVTIDKERVTGLRLEDRLLLLSLYTQRQGRTGVALVNRGLYFEQAQAFRSVLGDEVELSFVVGMDKLLQILDPQYYQDRDAALRQLFSLTSLVVANRGAMAREEFDQLLKRPENRPYRPFIHFCSLPEAVADVSATAVREGLAAGKTVGDLAPAETAAFLAETYAFHPPVKIGREKIDRYSVRQKLFDLLFAGRVAEPSTIDFRALLQAALAEDKRGRTLRRASSPAELK